MASSIKNIFFNAFLSSLALLIKPIRFTLSHDS